MARRLSSSTKLITGGTGGAGGFNGNIILTGDPKDDVPILDKLSDEVLERIFIYNQIYNTNDYWLHRLNIYYPGLEPYLGLISAATAYRRLKELGVGSGGGDLSREQIINMILNNDLYLLKYFYRRNNFDFTNLMIDTACSQGNQMILDFFNKRPTQNGINLAAKNNHLDFIRYHQYNNGLLPDIFQGALSNDEEMLDFLLDFEELTDTKYINLDIIDDITPEIFILLLNSFKIQRNAAANLLVEKGNLNNLGVLYNFLTPQSNIMISGDSIKHAQEKGFSLVVAWCEDNGFFANSEDFEMRVSDKSERKVRRVQSPTNRSDRSTGSIGSPAYREARSNPFGYPTETGPLASSSPHRK